MNNLLSKKCTVCLNDVPICKFHKSNNNKDGLRYDCMDCRKKYSQLNREYKKEYNKKYYLENKDLLNEKNTAYRLNNAEKINLQRKSYREKSDVKEHIKNKNKEYLQVRNLINKQKRVSDNYFRTVETLKSKFHRAINRKLSNPFVKILGIDKQIFLSWITFLFKGEMSFDNYSLLWEYDHVLPISLFKFNDDVDVKICFSWTNLQPLEKETNRYKSNKLNVIMIIEHFKKVKIFIDNNSSLFNGYQNIYESLCWLREKLRYGENSTDEEINCIDDEINSIKHHINNS